MLILSNSFTEKADEGALKVANSLAKRLKAAVPGTIVVSYQRTSELADVHMELNKLLLNRELIALLRRQRQPVLYIPFPAKVWSMVARTLILSVFSPGGVRVLFSMTGTYDAVAKWLLKLSGAHIYALSREAAAYYAGFLGSDRVTRLTTGVDTARFCPVSETEKRALRQRYGLDPDRKTVLHVGHLKQGRNIAHLMKLDPSWQILLAVSTLTAEERDEDLRRQLESCPNIRILDEYIPRIQELYQLSDAYFFPVTNKSNCIEVPVSVLEAAACGKPVVTTDLGELKAFRDAPGFVFIESFEAEELNRLLRQAMEAPDPDIRRQVLAYDWKNAVAQLASPSMME